MTNMMMEKTTVLGQVAPADAVGIATSAWAQASGFHKYTAMVLVGAAAGDIDLKIICASDDLGTGAEDVPHTTVPTVLQADASDQAIFVDVQADCIPRDKPYLAVSVNGGGSPAAAILFGADPLVAPVKHKDGDVYHQAVPPSNLT